MNISGFCKQLETPKDKYSFFCKKLNGHNEHDNAFFFMLIVSNPSFKMFETWTTNTIITTKDTKKRNNFSFEYFAIINYIPRLRQCLFYYLNKGPRYCQSIVISVKLLLYWEGTRIMIRRLLR